MSLHDTEELDDDLRRRPDENLTLAAALSIDNVVLQSFGIPSAPHSPRSLYA